MPTISLTIANKLGLHARPAAKIAQLANQFPAEIQISTNNKTINAKSIMQVMMLAASQGTEITISAEGDQADNALAALKNLVESKFDES